MGEEALPPHVFETMRLQQTSLIMALLALGGQATAQSLAIPIELPASSQVALSAAQIDRLVAPVALYPDPVLSDILTASTYPAQVVEAARFAAAHEGLAGAALADAATAENWDTSVEALLGFPSVLHMLDGNLEWTDQLGRAFISQQGDVMDAIQRLRLAAERTGALQNGPDAAVVNDGGSISINPPSPETVYLPSYDAACVYGDSGAACAAGADAIGWDGGVFVPFGFGEWAVLDWAHRGIRRSPRHAHDGSRPRGGPGAADTAWRHEGAPAFHLRSEANGPDHYAYAPPAGTIRPGYGVRAPAGYFVSSGVIHATGMSGGAHVARGPARAAPAARPGLASIGLGGHR